jgi:hypothetical protein
VVSLRFNYYVSKRGKKKLELLSFRVFCSHNFMFQVHIILDVCLAFQAQRGCYILIASVSIFILKKGS